MKSYSRKELLKLQKIAMDYAKKITINENYTITDQLIRYVKTNSFNDVFTHENYKELINQKLYELPLSKYPFEEETDEEIPIKNKATIQPMDKKEPLTNKDIKKSPKKDNIYYLYEYLPKYRCDGFTNEILSEEVSIIKSNSEKILKYKNHEDEEYDLITNKLIEGIILISNKFFKKLNKIAIVCVPSSKIEKQPQTCETINIIEEKYKNNYLKEEFKFNKKIINGNKYLTRIEDTESLHLGMGDRSFEKQYKTIKATEDLSKFKGGIILLDDIVTSSNSLKASKLRLIQKGAKRENIVSLTVGATMWHFTEIEKNDVVVKLNKTIEHI